MDTLFTNNFGFMHFFHSIYFLGLFEFHTPNLTEPSLTYYVLTIEMLPCNFFAFEDQTFFFLFCIQLREIYFETIFDIFGWFFWYSWVTSIVFFFSFINCLFGLSSLFFLLRSARHNYSSVTVDTHFPTSKMVYLECWAESCWLWAGIRIGSTLGLLFLWELRSNDLVGMVIGMDLLIFLKKLLTIAADDLRG